MNSYEKVYQHCRNVRLMEPMIFTDRVSEFTCQTQFSIWAAEHHDQAFCVRWGSVSVFAADEKKVLEDVENSDIVLLTTRSRPLNPGQFEYPFNQAMRVHLPVLLEYCRKEMVEIDRFRAHGDETVVFAKPRPTMEGLSGDWILSEGLTLRTQADNLRSHPIIELKGISDTAILAKPLAVEATVVTADGENRKIKGEMDGAEGKYSVRFDTGEIVAEPNSEVEINVEFKTWFVPAEIPSAKSNDARRLVVVAPQSVRMLRATDSQIQTAAKPDTAKKSKEKR